MPFLGTVSYVLGQDGAAKGGMGAAVSHLVMHGLSSPPNRQFAMLYLKLSVMGLELGGGGRGGVAMEPLRASTYRAAPGCLFASPRCRC